MGRPRIPTALHQAHGTYRADRHGRTEPQSPLATSELPEWAELTGEAAACYQRLASLLTSMQVLTEADVGALVQLSRRYGEYLEAAGEVRECGATYRSEGRDGMRLKTHPAVAIRDRAWTDVERGLAQFGLTPASRSRVVRSLERPDPLGGLLTSLR